MNQIETGWFDLKISVTSDGQTITSDSITRHSWLVGWIFNIIGGDWETKEIFENKGPDARVYCVNKKMWENSVNKLGGDPNTAYVDDAVVSVLQALNSKKLQGSVGVASSPLSSKDVGTKVSITKKQIEHYLDNYLISENITMYSTVSIYASSPQVKKDLSKLDTVGNKLEYLNECMGSLMKQSHCTEIEARTILLIAENGEVFKYLDHLDDSWKRSANFILKHGKPYSKGAAEA